MKRKCIALLLCLVMVTGLIPGAFASADASDAVDVFGYVGDEAEFDAIGLDVSQFAEEPAFIWQRSVDSGANWADIPDATEPYFYEVIFSGKMDGFLYR